MSQARPSGCQAETGANAGVQRLLHTVLVPKHDEALRMCQGVQAQLLETATLLADAGPAYAEKLATLRSQYADIVTLQHEITTHKDCMPAAVEEHNNSEKAAFETCLNNALAGAQAQSQFHLEGSDAMKKFNQETGADAGQGQAAGCGDDDLMMVTNTALVNEKCPYTQKSVLELDCPVEDSRGYIYEKSAIMERFQRARGQPIRCPMAGTNHNITADQLKPSASVARHRRRMLLQGDKAGAGPSAAEDEAFDIDNLPQ